jgi:hypothetical protein
MKRIIRLTESDLTRIIKKTINEMEDEDFMRGADRNWDDDFGYEEEEEEEWGETDRGEQELQDLIEEARDILENELGMSIDAINEMDEYYIVDVLHDYNYDELAYDIEYLLEKEGFDDLDDMPSYKTKWSMPKDNEEEFRKIDTNEPYDSIGGHSVNDLKKAFAKTKGRDEELGEGWDDFIQKKRHPEDYKPENYRRLPKDVFKSGSKIDHEGTIITKKYEDPFDEYEDFEDEEFA